MANDTILSADFGAGRSGPSSGTQWFPDPFLDYSGMYTPRNLRSMLRWCELFWAHNGTYRMALERVVAYFLTKIEILEVSDSIKKKYEEFLNDTLKAISVMRLIGLDLVFYGNSFSSQFVPFRRYLRCTCCRLERPIEHTTYSFVRFKFYAACPKCKQRCEHKSSDRRSMEQDKLKIIRWNPHNMNILFHPLSHEMRYFYRIPEDFKRNIKEGRPFHLQFTPWEYVEAIEKDQLFGFNDNIVFHLKEDTLSGLQNRGWGIPRALSNFKQGFYIQVLKRYNEALAMDYIVPWRVITPGGPRGHNKLDPLLNANLGEFSNRVRGMIAERRRDPLAMHSLPFPVEYQLLGGEGQELAPHEMITVALDELLNSCGVPAELYKGTLEYQAMPASLRLFEATWPHLVSGLNNWLNWLLEGLAMTFNWERARGRMTPVTRADDMEARMVRLQLSAANKISDTTALAPFGIDVREEIRRIIEEQRIYQEEQSKAQKEMEQQEEMQRRVAETAAMRQGQMPGMPGGGGIPGMGPGGGMGAPGGGAQGQVTPGDLLTQADQIAQQLLTMDDTTRKQRLSQLRQTDKTLHAVVKQKLEDNRNQMRSMGQQQIMSQMTGGPSPQPMM